MDDRELAKLLKGAGEDPAYIIGTSSTLNADGTVTISGGGRSVTAIAQTAFRSGTWSAKRVGNTWYAWSGNAPVVESESKIQRRGKPVSKPKQEGGLIVLVSVTKSGQEYFYAISETDSIEEVAVLPIASAYALAHLSFVVKNGKKSFLFACAYRSSPTDSTDTTGVGYFLNPAHYTMVMKGLQNWILNSYFEDTTAGGLGNYIGSGFWASYVIVGTVQQSAAFYTYSVKSPINNTDVPVKKMVVVPSSTGYLVAPEVIKVVDTDRIAAAILLSIDKKSIFYLRNPLSETGAIVILTSANSQYIRKRADTELVLAMPAEMRIANSLTVCEYKNKIYNFHPLIGSFPFFSSVTLDDVKAHGIRVYAPTVAGGTITYQEESERIPIQDFKGIDTLPSGAQVKVHSAFYG